MSADGIALPTRELMSLNNPTVSHWRTLLLEDLTKVRIERETQWGTKDKPADSRLSRVEGQVM